MFGELIVPIDGSNHGLRALRVARTLAEQLDGVVRVRAFGRNLAVSTFTQRIHDQTGATLHGVRTDVQVRHRSRSVVDDILSELWSHPGSLLCMPTHGYGMSAGLLGSVAAGVVAGAGHPVLLAGPQCDAAAFDPVRPVLLSIDPLFERELADRVAHGWSTLFGVPSQAIAVADPDHDQPVADDVIAATVVAEASALDASVIVMTTHARRGFRRAIGGSVAGEVLRVADRPVLMVASPTQVRPPSKASVSLHGSDRQVEQPTR